MVYTVSTDLILRRMSRNRKNSIPPSNTRDLTEFLKALHEVMLDRNSDATRRTHMGIFTGDVVDLDPVTGTVTFSLTKGGNGHSVEVDGLAGNPISALKIYSNSTYWR